MYFQTQGRQSLMFTGERPTNMSFRWETVPPPFQKSGVCEVSLGAMPTRLQTHQKMPILPPFGQEHKFSFHIGRYQIIPHPPLPTKHTWYTHNIGRHMSPPSMHCPK